MTRNKMHALHKFPIIHTKKKLKTIKIIDKIKLCMKRFQMNK